MNHAFQCRCGAVRGSLSGSARVTRAVCYCRSCQAWACYLGREEALLDAAGGTEVLMTQPHHVSFAHGLDRLACVRLTAKGPLRWYAACCRSPLGNTSASARLPYLGLMSAVLRYADSNPASVFGPVRLQSFTGHARGDEKPRAYGLVGALMRILSGMASARLGGAWRDNPFFDTAANEPIAAPRELDDSEREELYARLKPTPR